MEEILRPLRVPRRPLLMGRFGQLALQSCERVARRFADAPARALLLPAATGPTGGKPADRDQLYQAHSVIRDRAGQLRNFFEYHQVQRGDGKVVAIALRRDFAGAERWEGDGEVLAAWPRAHTGGHDRTALPGPWPKAPEGRYAPQAAIGLPCWLPFQRCPAELP
jgi:hypothetical protein